MIAAVREKGLSYDDLYDPEKLRELFERWHATLTPSVAARYDAWRAKQELPPEELSQILVDVAPTVSKFVVELFGVEAEWQAQKKAVDDELIVFRFKDDFVKRRASKKFNQ